MSDVTNSDSSHKGPRISIEAVLAQMQSMKNNAKLHQGADVRVATAIVLLEIASSDNIVDKFEKSVIHNGLKSIFRISDQAALSVIAQAKSAIASMRSSSAEASMLRDLLDPSSKRAVANLIDSLIRCNGVVDTMETYLRHRFRSLLGLPDEPLPQRTDE